MSSDDEGARIERARRLREEIASLEEDGDGVPDSTPSSEPESPRDFIHRRMREEAEREDAPGEDGDP